MEEKQLTEKYFFDTDCLSAFLWVREESILAKLYAGRIILPAQVYKELKKVPHLLARADTLKSNGDLLVESMEVGSEEYNDYLRMTTAPEPGMRIIGSGEAAGIAMAKTGTPAMTVIPATDTIVCSVDGKRIDQVPDRTTMYQMQTPQTFGAVLFRRCFEQLTVEEQNTVTDASGVFLRTGVPVGMVAGAKTNIKITWPEDLIIAEQFCR